MGGFERGKIYHVPRRIHRLRYDHVGNKTTGIHTRYHLRNLPVEVHSGISVLQSRCCHFTPKHLDKNHGKGINVIPLVAPEVHWEIGIGWQKDGYLSLATRKWIEFLQEKLQGEHKKSEP